ncbi:MAG: DUF4381 domain-containing protein [Gammaproteobacteria bacterium]|nr:DUF4381 domain-containing protein [Gammaproteobacteria bacterium]
MEELLLQLKDIQAPQSPGWWPLAPGWWLLLAISCLSIAMWLVVKHKRRQGYFQLASVQLHHLASDYDSNGNHQQLLLGLSYWIRQVALLAFPDRRVADLTGESWVSFLDEPMTSHEFTQGPGYVFAGGVYASDIDVEAGQLLDLCQSWLHSVKPQLANRCSD